MKTELGITIRSSGPSKVNPELAGKLIEALREDEAGRLTAEDLARKLYSGDISESAKRRVRRLARQLRPRVVSFPGSDGYALWKRCPVDDIWHCVYAMEAAGTDLIKEAHEFRKALHSGYRGEPGDEAQAEMAFEEMAQ